MAAALFFSEAERARLHLSKNDQSVQAQHMFHLVEPADKTSDFICVAQIDPQPSALTVISCVSENTPHYAALLQAVKAYVARMQSAHPDCKHSFGIASNYAGDIIAADVRQSITAAQSSWREVADIGWNWKDFQAGARRLQILLAAKQIQFSSSAAVAAAADSKRLEAVLEDARALVLTDKTITTPGHSQGFIRVVLLALAKCPEQ